LSPFLAWANMVPNRYFDDGFGTYYRIVFIRSGIILESYFFSRKFFCVKENEEFSYNIRKYFIFKMKISNLINYLTLMC
jgi:hypothetical protein